MIDVAAPPAAWPLPRTARLRGWNEGAGRPLWLGARGADWPLLSRARPSGGSVMGNWDDRSGGERWRDRGQGNWRQDRDDRGEHRGREQGRYGGGDDRGFLDRAGDEVRSWFGDDEAQRRRERDQRRWEQEQRMSGRRDNESGPGSFGGGGFGTGWGNQAGRSWNRERPGERDYDDQPRGGGERHYARGEREGWFTDSVGGERGERYGGGGGGGADYGSRSSEFFRGSGFGGDYER